MTPERTPDLFDAWAENYDYYAENWTDTFPFIGYKDVLNRIVELCDPKPGMKILDLGVGTGTLAQKFVEANCEVWGVDFSGKMLELAKKKVPSAHLFKADIRSTWPDELQLDYDRIVSAYVFHHFDFDSKMDLIRRIANESLGDRGRIVIGDISFRTFAEHSNARQELSDSWDDDEYYWSADLVASMLRGEGLYIAYEQISSCAGVYAIVSSEHL
ncbi:MAG: class I SAM-dependent methyltransferase [Candidatus Thorarchaeota archaeon]